MGRQKRQSGFSILGIVVAVVAVAAIGTAGWFVYQHNKVKLTGATGGTQTTNQGGQQQTPPATTAVKVPELGIQITVPDSIKDLTYQVSTVKLSPNGNQATLAMFSTKALTALDANCGVSSGALGSLERASGQYPTQAEDETNVLDYGQLLKQFPTFYISVGYPQAACSTAATAGSASAAASNEAARNTAKQAFVSSLSTIQPLN